MNTKSKFVLEWISYKKIIVWNETIDCVKLNENEISWVSLILCVFFQTLCSEIIALL